MLMGARDTMSAFHECEITHSKKKAFWFTAASCLLIVPILFIPKTYKRFCNHFARQHYFEKMHIEADILKLQPDNVKGKNKKDPGSYGIMNKMKAGSNFRTSITIADEIFPKIEIRKFCE